MNRHEANYVDGIGVAQLLYFGHQRNDSVGLESRTALCIFAKGRDTAVQDMACWFPTTKRAKAQADRRYKRIVGHAQRIAPFMRRLSINKLLMAMALLQRHGK
ncbi:MAG: hypothetical protein FJY37_12720 [Betaproteobacteria bacterium]|nr:hypothetical protein [Betaproteobacteria bacterium]